MLSSSVTACPSPERQTVSQGSRQTLESRLWDGDWLAGVCQQWPRDQHLGKEREGRRQELAEGRGDAFSVQSSTSPTGARKLGLPFGGAPRWHEGAMAFSSFFEQSWDSGYWGGSFLQQRPLAGVFQLANESSTPARRSGWRPSQCPPPWPFALDCLLLECAQHIVLLEEHADFHVAFRSYLGVGTPTLWGWFALSELAEQL